MESGVGEGKSGFGDRTKRWNVWGLGHEVGALSIGGAVERDLGSGGGSK